MTKNPNVMARNRAKITRVLGSISFGKYLVESKNEINEMDQKNYKP